MYVPNGIIRSRLTHLYYNLGRKEQSLSKFDRRYLLASFDALHTLDAWTDLRVSDFPLRQHHVPRSRLPKLQIDMNDDSDDGVEFMEDDEQDALSD